MDRYLVFMGDEYCPYGGWDDFEFKLETNDIDDVKEFMKDLIQQDLPSSLQWYQIVDTHIAAGGIVEKGTIEYNYGNDTVEITFIKEK